MRFSSPIIRATIAAALGSLALASTAAAAPRLAVFDADRGGLQFYIQGDGISVAWNNPCRLIGATGPFALRQGRFAFSRAYRPDGSRARRGAWRMRIDARGSIAGRRLSGQIRLRTRKPGCDTGWHSFVAMR